MKMQNDASYEQPEELPEVVGPPPHIIAVTIVQVVVQLTVFAACIKYLLS